MSTCLRNRKKINQGTVDWLFALYKLAKRNDYSDEEAKKIGCLL